MIKFGFLLMVAALVSSADVAEVHWALESLDGEGLIVRGEEASRGVGIAGGRCVRLDGRTTIEVSQSTALSQGLSGFTMVAWVNPYAIGKEQQMIVGKNRYSLDEREWGVMIDKDGRFRLYAYQLGWRTVAADEMPIAGRWYQIGIVSDSKSMTLWVNGKPVGSLTLSKPLLKTAAPLTFGGVNDNGRVFQTLFGALDELRLWDHPLGAAEMAAIYLPVTEGHEIPKRPGNPTDMVDPYWEGVGRDDAGADWSTLVFDGKSPDQLACDTTLRRMPDGSWVLLMLGGGDTEPMPRNRVFLSRSLDEGRSWSPMTPVDLGVKSVDATTALVPSELMVHEGRCTMFVATHDGTFANWREWMTHSDDSGRTWSRLEAAPGRLKERTFIRNHIVTRDGRILLPFQHYQRVAATREISKKRRFSAPTDPRNGVLVSDDGGRTWSEHGNIRISPDDNYHGWAENNIVELADGRIAMIIRADRLGGVLYYAESSDGGRTWPEFGRPTTIPNPGSKATLYPLGGDTVALLHNPNSRGRYPLSMWISFDGMKTWPYRRVLVPESSKGAGKALNYPDGFVSADKRWLHFAYDDARYRAVSYSAKLPERSAMKPNIVFILADDLGYGDLGCYGADDIRTPNLDRLAAEGIRFTDYYANGSVCSPTRAAFLTGRYQQRIGLDNALGYQEMGRGLPAKGWTIADALHELGYVTGLSGKWHLGYDSERRPTQQGFDHFFGLLGGNHHYFLHMDRIGVPDLWQGDEAVRREGYTTDLITADALGFIEQHRDRPFFLYLSHAAPHFPWQGPDDAGRVVEPRKPSWQQGDRETYVSMVERMDRGIGEVLAKLDEPGLRRRTLVVFSSDNGGHTHSRNAPLRDFKSSLWEGGIRVPCIARWPEVLPAGTSTAQVAITMDWTATFRRLAGLGEDPAGGDGIDLLPLLTGSEPLRDRTLFWRQKKGPVRRNVEEGRAVRDGRWKLVEQGDGGRHLFDLVNDLGESRNLIETNRDLAEELGRKLDEWELKMERE